MSERVTHILRAMAVNYLRADVFDTLDSQALHKAADQIDALHAEAEALRAALFGIASVNPAQRGIEWAKSYASDGLNGAGSELYARWLDTFKEAEALRAENGRLQADRDRANQYANQQALECNKLSTDLEAARGLLLEAAEDIESWGAYASAYFQEKHDLAGCAMKYRIAGAGDHEDGGAEQAAIAAMPITATQAPEVQASGPYASVAGALAQRYPKPSLLKDCNVSYSNSSRPLAEQGERQEAVAWALANSADEIGGFAPIYYTKEGAISWANGRNIFPLYTTPQPGPDVRSLVEALRKVAASLSWNCFGECRAVHDEPIMPAAGALEMARTALATYHQDTQPCPTP